MIKKTSGLDQSFYSKNVQLIKLQASLIFIGALLVTMGDFEIQESCHEGSKRTMPKGKGMYNVLINAYSSFQNFQNYGNYMELGYSLRYT